MKSYSYLLPFLLMLVTVSAHAQRNLRSEANLHPLDTFTADVLEKGEWYYGQPPIPAPGYNFYGLTDNTTVQLDYTAWLGGVPSLNVRTNWYKSSDERFSFASEFMLLYLDKDLDELDEDQDNLYLKREGANGYARLNFSYKLSENSRIHSSIGVSYSEFLEIRNEERDTIIGETFEELVDPVFMIGYEHFINDNLMFVCNLSYGETWLLMENRPRKEQFVYGFRWVPFPNSPRPILHNMAIDLIALGANFPDAEESVGFPVPLFPVFTWQW